MTSSTPHAAASALPASVIAMTRRRWHALPFRSQQLLIVVAAALPIVVLAALLLAWGMSQHRGAVERGLTDTARALATAVDRQVAAWQAAVDALAASPDFDRGDFASLHAQASAIARRHDGAIVVFDALLQQRINTLRPYGDPLPKAAYPDPVRRVFASGQPQVSGPFFGEVAQRWIVAIDVPVKRQGKVVYDLNLFFDPAVLSRLLADQRLAAGWIARITNAQDEFVARHPDAAAFVGSPAPPWWSEATAGESGIFRGPSLAGTPHVFAFHRLAGAPWTVAVAVPEAALVAAWRRQLFLFGGLALVAIVVAAVLAWRFSRRVTHPLEALAASAGDVMAGRPSAIAPLEIPEFETLRRALERAAATARQAVAAQERAAASEASAAALREAAERLRLAMAAGRIATWDWEIGSGLVTHAENMAELLDVEPGAFGSTVDEFLAVVHPDDRQRVGEALEEALAGRAEYGVEFRLTGRGGEDLWMRSRGIVLNDDAGQPVRMIGICTNVTQRKKTEERQARMMAELDHRVKNVLATVQAIASHTFGDGPERAAYLDRLAALAGAHDLVQASHWQAIDLSVLVARELAPFSSERVTIAGPPLGLSPRATQALALALHELATNAAKHGALSGEAGQVAVGWRIEDDDAPRLRLDWSERGGPPVGPPARTGFGIGLVRGSIEYDLGGECEVSFLPAGLSVGFDIPVRRIAPSLGG